MPDERIGKDIADRLNAHEAFAPPLPDLCHLCGAEMPPGSSKLSSGEIVPCEKCRIAPPQPQEDATVCPRWVFSFLRGKLPIWAEMHTGGPHEARECVQALDAVEAEIISLTQQLAALQRRVEVTEADAKAHRDGLNRGIDELDKVFQVRSDRPPPLLPDFLRLGECKFRGVVKLAEAYIAQDAELAALRQERDLLQELFDVADDRAAMPPNIYRLDGTDKRIEFGSVGTAGKDLKTGWKIVGENRIYDSSIDCIRAALHPAAAKGDG